MALAGALPAADVTKPPTIAMADAIARQKQAVSSMAASLRAQRHSLQSQVAHLPPHSFFALPPLHEMASEVTTPMLEWGPAIACPPLRPDALEILVGEAAQREHLDPDLLRSVIHQESAARPCALSPKGAMGLMQLMPATAVQLGVADAFDPKENVDAGARLLKQFLNLFGGDVSLALGAFNAGPAKVSESGGLPDYRETLEYVQKVLTAASPAH